MPPPEFLMVANQETGPPRGADLEDAVAWASTHGFDPHRVEPLPGDVSSRRYVRLRGRETTAILALYPPDAGSGCHRFERTSTLLADSGIRVPRILAAECGRGRMLLEDVGPRTLYDHRDEGWAALGDYLAEAAEIAGRLRTIPARSVAGLNPPLDRELLERELETTWTLALGSRRLSQAGFSTALEEALGQLVARLAEAERTVAHRDFMARNLVPLAGEHRLAVLDHQDLRLAPLPYDLASLLNDSLYPPVDLEERLLARHLGEDQRLDYHRAAAQRCLKIVGTFVGFERRGFRRHRRLIPPSLERARRHLGELPETRRFASELEELISALARAVPSPSEPSRPSG